MNILFNTTSLDEIQSYLLEMNAYFVPALGTEIDIYKYSKKIFDYANRLELKIENKLMGLLAFYLNEKENVIYITTFSIHPSIQKSGKAQDLLNYLIEIYKDNNVIQSIELEVNYKNFKAKNFYYKNNFIEKQQKTNTSILERKLNKNA